MKRIMFLCFYVFMFLLLVGCFNRSADTNINNQNELPIDADQNQGADLESDDPFPKFYPDNNQSTRTDTPTDSGSQNVGSDFVVTQELVAKLYLVDKYDPGICYGMPGPVSDSAISGLISYNQDLAQFLKSSYNLQTDLEIYNKIKQINGVRLTELAGGKYQFNFTNGQCCILKAYEGEILIIGRTISDEIIRTETQNNPC